MSEIRKKFWEQKLEIARVNHRDEMRKMNGQGGASFRLLERYAKDAERAQRELTKLTVSSGTQ